MIKPRKCIAEMDAYNPPIEGRSGKIRLDFNENTSGCSPKVLKAVRGVSASEIATYPEYDAFVRKLAGFLKVDKNKLMINNATDESIMVVMQTYIGRGDEIVLPVPTFAMFKFYAQIADAKIREVLYNKDRSFPAVNVLKAVNDKTKLVVLVNPNNPTGTSIERKDIIKIAEKAKNAIVLLDEAYVQYSGESCADLVDRYGNLIVIQTFSKAFGLAGARLGYAISNKENIKNLLKVRSPYSINRFAVKAAEAAIEDIDFVNKYVKEVRESKQILYDELGKLGVKFYRSDANFIVIDFGDKNKKVDEELNKKGILVRDRSRYPLLEHCTRITVGTKEQVEELVKTLRVVL